MLWGVALGMVLEHTIVGPPASARPAHRAASVPAGPGPP